MPLPRPKPHEDRATFMDRCMTAVRNEFDSQDQRVAVCLRYWNAGPPKKDIAMSEHDIETKDFGFEVKDLTEKGTFEGYASTFGNVDSGGDKIAPGAFAESMNTHYRKGTMPLMLWSHDPMSPIGTWKDVSEDGKGLHVKGALLVGQNVPEADKVHSLLKAKAVRGLSIGYRVVDSENDGPVRVLKQVDLPEISVVSFPMNASARVDAVKASARWSVGAARDLPISSSAAWDGGAAAGRILDAAGFDGDNPDSGKARRGFLIFDAGNPDLRGSYKLPFADMVGGKLTAVEGGLRAAASRLPQTDAPQGVKDRARAVLDAYFTRLNAGKLSFDEIDLAARLQEFARKLRDGEPLPVKEFEDILREAGVPKSMAVQIASVGYARSIRSESGGNEASTALDRILSAARAFHQT